MSQLRRSSQQRVMEPHEPPVHQRQRAKQEGQENQYKSA